MRRQKRATRKGYASLPLSSVEKFQQSVQTLCINAAMEGDEGTLENVPWVVDLNLPVQ